MEKAHVSPTVSLNTKFRPYVRGEKLPTIKTPNVIDPEKTKLLEPLAKKIGLYMDFMLSGRGVKVSVKVISQKMIEIDISRASGNIDSMIHGELYDPASYTLVRVYGVNMDIYWGIRILLYFTRLPVNRDTHKRILELLSTVLKLEELYL